MLADYNTDCYDIMNDWTYCCVRIFIYLIEFTRQVYKFINQKSAQVLGPGLGLEPSVIVNIIFSCKHQLTDSGVPRISFTVYRFNYGAWLYTVNHEKRDILFLTIT